MALSRNDAALVAQRFAKIPLELHDWYQAWLAAGMDITGGNVAKAVAIADKGFARSPKPPSDDDDGGGCDDGNEPMESSSLADDPRV